MPAAAKPELEREESLEAEQEELNLPPGRMHAVKQDVRLTAAPPGLNRILRRKMEGQSPMRSRSPSLKDRSTESNSSTSSLEDIIDSDILFDRQGFVELDVPTKLHNSREFTMPSVNERMTEDSLDDVHAFSDVPRSSNASRANSVSVNASEQGFLEALDECEEEDSDSDAGEAQVILTNIENLTLEAQNDGTTESLAGEAPTT